MEEHKLSRFFFGAPPKVASTSATTYFQRVRDKWGDFQCGDYHGGRKYSDQNSEELCQCSIAGMRRGMFRALLRKTCAKETLFVIPGREQLSWFESAYRHVCTRWTKN